MNYSIAISFKTSLSCKSDLGISFTTACFTTAYTAPLEEAFLPPQNNITSLRLDTMNYGQIITDAASAARYKCHTCEVIEKWG